MRYFSLLLVQFVIIPVFAVPQVVQVPDQCLDKETAPCLVRALNDSFKETSSHLKFYFGKDSLLKITHFPMTSVKSKVEQFKVELIKGQVVIANNEKVPFYVNTVNVGLNETYYIKKTNEVVELYKSGEAIFFNITKSDDMDLVETKDFASRKSTTEFINQFRNIPESVYKETLARYEVRLNDEVLNQQRVLQRKVAAEETTKKLDAEARQKQKIESKRLKEMFFMRTFKQ
jgi:hypothetical protein